MATLARPGAAEIEAQRGDAPLHQPLDGRQHHIARHIAAHPRMRVADDHGGEGGVALGRVQHAGQRQLAARDLDRPRWHRDPLGRRRDGAHPRAAARLPQREVAAISSFTPCRPPLTLSLACPSTGMVEGCRRCEAGARAIGVAPTLKQAMRLGPHPSSAKCHGEPPAQPPRTEAAATNRDLPRNAKRRGSGGKASTSNQGGRVGHPRRGRHSAARPSTEGTQSRPPDARARARLAEPSSIAPTRSGGGVGALPPQEIRVGGWVTPEGEYTARRSRDPPIPGKA